MRILLVNNDNKYCTAVSKILQKKGHNAAIALRGNDALDEFHAHPYPVVITELDLPDMSGIDLLRNVKQTHSDTMVILNAPSTSMDIAIKAFRYGAEDFLFRTSDDSSLMTEVLNKAEKKLRLIEEKRSLIEQLKYKNELLEQDNQKLGRWSMFDVCSGLYNQDCFDEMFGRELTRCQLYHRQFSLILLDISPFISLQQKTQTANTLLQGLAQVIKERFRRTDLVTRLREDYFAILLPETLKEGAVCVETILGELAKKYLKETLGAETTDDIIINFGLATFPEDGTDSMTLLKAAKKNVSQGSFKKYGTGTEKHECK